MAVHTSRVTEQRHTRPAQLLLRRRATVYVPTSRAIAVDAAVVPGVELLEADLIEGGWLLAPTLRDALLRLGTAELVNAGASLLADCDALLGADRPHVPLFRGFPTSTPIDTATFFVDRVLSAWFQAPGQPCVLCGTDGQVAPVNPCGHLVCSTCFDGADFAACPICHRRIDTDDPFLTASRSRPSRGVAEAPERLRVLHLGTDPRGDLRVELLALLARPAALPPADVDDLTVLLALESRTDLSWLPTSVPGRETKARLLAWLLADPAPSAVDRAAGLVDTATDVLRLLAVRSGGDASLVDRPRISPVPRPLRRALLGLLDGIAPARLIEDMRRHRRAWIAAGERLHPGEHAARYPGAALAFAALRGTDLAAHPRGALLARHAAGAPNVQLAADRVTGTGWGGLVETALADDDLAAAVPLLAARPGELLRRLDHLLRLTGTDGGREALFAALPVAVTQVSPQVLFSALGQLRTRSRRFGSRVFFPAGRTSAAHVIPDEREPLPADLVDRVVVVLRDEVLRRAAALPRVDRVVLDTALDDLVAPFAERTASRALVTLARGSVRPIPAGRYLRLFNHWTETHEGPQVDLDLSVALFDDAWQHLGTCDYTNLRLPGAVHSGDLTSAPAPLGASEFIDLDLDEIVGLGARHAVVVILSYNNVPFTDMAEAFAGFMLRSAAPEAGEVFDAAAVEQRFDLTGPGKLTMPFVVDLATRTMRWLDVAAQVTGTHHAVHRHHEKLALLGRALAESFDANARVTLGELGRWHAAARTDEVLVRGGSGLTWYRRRPGETPPEFAARLGEAAAGDGAATADDAATASLQFLLRGDLPTPAGADVYALHANALDASTVRQLAAADLAGELAPAP